MKFNVVVKYFEMLENTSSRIEMKNILHSLFLECPAQHFPELIYFCQGKIGAKYLGKEVNIGTSTLIAVIARYLGQDISLIEKLFLEKGDLGLVIQTFTQTSSQTTLFSVEKSFIDVYKVFEKMTEMSGKGAIEKKIKLFESLLYSTSLGSAKYLVRFPISLRLGFSDATIIDALSLLDTCMPEKEAKDLILNKYNLVSDLGFIAGVIKQKGITSIKDLEIQPFIPLKPELAERAKDLEEIFERLGNNDFFFGDSKIDGFRMQIHKFKSSVKIFSRNQEDITHMFPDIFSEIVKINHDFIIDAEAVGYDPLNKKYHPFQITMQRKRKYGISKISKQLPLHLKVFDVIFFNTQKEYLKPFYLRRQTLEKFFEISEIISTTKIVKIKTIQELKVFLKQSLLSGFEGIIAKDPNSVYTAGLRGFGWIKFKKSYDKLGGDTLDVVVLGGYFGKGKRTQTGLGALLIGVYDSVSENFFSLAKVGSGFKEKDLIDISSFLKDLRLQKKPDNLISNIVPDFYVEPKLVIEVNFDGLTISPLHTTPLKDTENTLALRFPRFVNYRFDKSFLDASSLDEIARVYELYK